MDLNRAVVAKSQSLYRVHKGVVRKMLKVDSNSYSDSGSVTQLSPLIGMLLISFFLKVS